MENSEEKTEKQPENTETKPKSVKIDGISSQINLGQGTPAHQQWARIMVTSGHSSPSACLKMVMDAYESPARNADDQATIANLENEVKEATDTIGKLGMQNDDLVCENRAYEATLQNKDLEIADLKKQLEAANRTANENAVNGLGKQAQIEDLQKQLAESIVIQPNPVVKYFLDEMSHETGKSPSEILQALYIADLQNPRANNLPYIVSSSRIREVMEELKQQQNG